MYRSKELSLDDRRKLYLDMMTEIDSFCRSNNIKYSLSCGTLLGAIRHHGFIPWDDDFDIMMPLPEMIRFKKLFHSDNLRYVDVDIDYKHIYPFSEIESLKTIRKPIPFIRSHGLYIDLYPILGLPDDKDEIDKFIQKGFDINSKREKKTRLTKGVRHAIPLFQKCFLSKYVSYYRNYMFQFPYLNAKYFYHLGGYPKWRAVLDEDYFEELIDAEFEGHKFLITSKYDKMLSQFYGNYMEYPPVEKRIPTHNNNYFWK